jgi:hypothetical protein
MAGKNVQNVSERRHRQNQAQVCPRNGRKKTGKIDDQQKDPSPEERTLQRLGQQERGEAAAEGRRRRDDLHALAEQGIGKGLGENRQADDERCFQASSSKSE